MCVQTAVHPCVATRTPSADLPGDGSSDMLGTQILYIQRAWPYAVFVIHVRGIRCTRAPDEVPWKLDFTLSRALAVCLKHPMDSRDWGAPHLFDGVSKLNGYTISALVSTPPYVSGGQRGGAFNTSTSRENCYTALLWILPSLLRDPVNI